MRDYTINKYKKVIDIAMQKSLTDGFITRSDFDVLAEEHKMTHTIATYLQRMNIIQRIDANKFHFVRPVTVPDIKEMGAMQMKANIRNREKRSKNAKQMSIEPITSNFPDSDDFAAKMMAYLESRGFKVTKEKHNLPVVIYRGPNPSLSPSAHKATQEVGHLEIKHIMMAYGVGQSGKYNTPEEYMKNEYNDFTA